VVILGEKDQTNKNGMAHELFGIVLTKEWNGGTLARKLPQVRVGDFCLLREVKSITQPLDDELVGIKSVELFWKV
jgi:hypothetical protein